MRTLLVAFLSVLLLAPAAPASLAGVAYPEFTDKTSAETIEWSDIVDTETEFEITLHSLGVRLQADVAIMNAQDFILQSGQQVYWFNVDFTTEPFPTAPVRYGSGLAIADGSGIVKVQDVWILAAGAGNRLRLVAQPVNQVETPLSVTVKVQAVSPTRCQFTVRVVPPDTSGGWRRQVFSDGIKFGTNELTMIAVGRLGLGTHSFTVRLSKAGETDVTTTPVNSTCSGG